MCAHKQDDGKRQGFVSTLCQKCSNQERFDQREMQKLLKGLSSRQKREFILFERLGERLSGGLHGIF